MTQHERTGWRDTTFSSWRRASGKSFLDERHTAQDIDWLEYCTIHKEPIALIDGVCRDSTQELKEAALKKYVRPMKVLAESCGIDCYVMAYVADHENNIVLHGLFLNCFSGEITEVLDGFGISKFIHDIHTNCKQCKEIKKHVPEWNFWEWRHTS